MAATMAMSINLHRHVLARCYALLIVLMMLATTTSATPTETNRSRKVHIEAVDAGGYKTFIMLLERRPPAGVMDDVAAHQAWHESFLPSKLTELGESRLLRSYRFLLNGFATRLTEAEVQQVATKPGFVAAFPNNIHYLQTRQTTPRQRRGLKQGGGGGGLLTQESK